MRTAGVATSDLLGLAWAVAELWYGTGDCPVEPWIPTWVTSELTSSNLSPEKTSYRKF